MSTEDVVATPPGANTDPATADPAAGTATPATAAATTPPADPVDPAVKAAADAAIAKAQGAPEAYEFAAPEGVQLNEQLVGEFTPIAKELNLTQESAQKLVDFYARSQAAQVVAEQSAWVETAKTDKEIGGPKLAENLALATKTFETFGTPELRALLEERGLGNHPELVRWAVRVGKAMSQDGMVTGGNTGPTSDARGFYRNSNMNP